MQKSVSYTVFLVFCYEDGFLATWDPSQMKDLKIPHLLRLPFDGISPGLCRFKVTKFMFVSDKTAHIPQTSICYLLCLQRHHHRKDGERYLHFVFTLNPAIPSVQW